MEYIPLNKLPNKYPDISNYMWEDGNYIVLEGEYDSNYIAFRKPFLSQLKWVTGTDFKFIVGLKTSDTDPYQQFYTSEEYYKLLEKSLLDNCVEKIFDNEKISEITRKNLKKAFHSLIRLLY